MSGYLPSQSITTRLRRRPALPKSDDEIEDVEADAAHFVGDRRLVGERVGDERRVGPDHELIVVVGVRAVELPRQRHEIELRLPREPLADGRRSAGGRARRRSG